MVRVNKALIKRLDYLEYGIKNTTWLQLIGFALTPKILGKVILDQVVNKYNLGRHLTGFFILNKDPPPKSGRLITIGSTWWSPGTWQYYWCSVRIVSIDYQSKRRDVRTAAHRWRCNRWSRRKKFLLGGWAPTRP